MPDKKISVIIPIYNVEDYLNRCVESIVGQTYKNLEVILVDDGSSDGSPKICDDWAKKDSRVKVIHKKNGGVSSARNSGLNIFTGDFTVFVDSDDYLSLDFMEKLLQKQKENDADIVRCSRSICNDDGDFEYQSDKFYKKFIGTNDRSLIALVNGTIWATLYKREVVKDIRFSYCVKISEDTEFTLKAFFNAKSFGFVDDYLYHYYMRNNSAVNHIYAGITEDINKGAKLCKVVLKDNNQTKYIPFFDYIVYHMCCTEYVKYWNKDLYNKFKNYNTRKGYHLFKIKSGKQSFITRIKSFMYRYRLFNLYKFILKLKKIFKK